MSQLLLQALGGAVYATICFFFFFSLRSGQVAVFSIFRVSGWKQRAGPCYSPLLCNDIREDHSAFWAKWSFLLHSSASPLGTSFLSFRPPLRYRVGGRCQSFLPWHLPLFLKYFLGWCKLLVTFHSSDTILPDILCLFSSVSLEDGITGVYGTLDTGVWGHHCRFPFGEATWVMCQCVYSLHP